ncbi:MAG TPA: DUF1080 domain-containing protein [Cyclobacteriaceae bacterium]|nr:DUF1080 domain-containing protein [Cyclobacteriaceae bacterium]
MKSLNIIAAVLITTVIFSCSKKTEKLSLFNGKDLTGWDSYIGPAYDTARKKFDTIPGPGLNNDSGKVFSVVEVDGEPAIRVSGERFGGLSTTEEFSNYHLTVQFKWGEAKHVPKLDDKRDSGLLYHGVGDHGADGGFWLRSQEFQVQEGDCGDYWGCAGGAFDVPVIAAVDNGLIYTPTGVLTSFSEKSKSGRHVIKSSDGEKRSGEWNTLELYCYGDSSIHVVNGVVNMKLFHSRQVDGDVETPLKKGKIQFQSEGAELFYRRLYIEKISAMPDLD